MASFFAGRESSGTPPAGKSIRENITVGKRKGAVMEVYGEKIGGNGKNCRDC